MYWMVSITCLLEGMCWATLGRRRVGVVACRLLETSRRVDGDDSVDTSKLGQRVCIEVVFSMKDKVARIEGTWKL